MDKITFTAACKQFFGLKPGESLGAFGQELKALTPKDKTELADMLADHFGVTVEVAPAA